MHYSCVVTPSTCEPLTNAEGRAWLRLGVDPLEDDPIVDALITASRRVIEDRTRRLYFRSACALHLDGFPSDSTGVIKVPVSPLVSVSSITYYGTTDGATVMSTSDYTVDVASEPGRIGARNYGSWPTATREIDGVVVALTAGYSTSTGDGSTGLPAECAPMLAAQKLLLAHWYENRQAVTLGGGAAVELPIGVEYLLAGMTMPEVEG